MINAVSGWARDIFITASVISFIEIVIPSGTMKKYLRMIFGIIIIAVALSPVTGLFSEGGSDLIKKAEDSIGVGGTVKVQDSQGNEEKMNSEESMNAGGNEKNKSVPKEAETTESALIQKKAEASYKTGSLYDGEKLADIQRRQSETVFKEEIISKTGNILAKNFPNMSFAKIEVLTRKTGYGYGEDYSFDLDKIVITGDEYEYKESVEQCVAEELNVSRALIKYERAEG